MLERPDMRGPPRSRLHRDEDDEPEEFTGFVAGEIDKWAPVARRVMPGK